MCCRLLVSSVICAVVFFFDITDGGPTTACESNVSRHGAARCSHGREGCLPRESFA